MINGTEYFFAVTALDAKGNESALSEEESAEPTLTPDTTAPSAPTSVTATPGDNKVTVRWIANEEDTDIASFQVLRGITVDGPFTPLAGDIAGTATSYVDLTAVNGNPYFYVVTAKRLRRQRLRPVTGRVRDPDRHHRPRRAHRSHRDGRYPAGHR